MSATSERPKISIGLPVRNGAKHLSEALDAILSQTYSDFEIVASDNASMDSTLAILKRYASKDRRIRVFHHSKNRGAAFNFNFVFHQSSGEYFKWAAHDDLIESDYLERTCSILDAEHAAVLVYPATIYIDEQGCPIGHEAEDRVSFENRSNNTAKRFHSQLRKFASPVGFHGLMRSAALAKTGLFGEFISADKALLRSLVLHGEIIKIPEPLFLFRCHAEMASLANRSIEESHYWHTAQTNGFPRMWFAGHVKYHIINVARAELDAITKIRCWFSIGTYALRRWYFFFNSRRPRVIPRSFQNHLKQVRHRIRGHMAPSAE